MSHTPGPWYFEAENGRAHPRVYGADNSLICEVGNVNLMRWEVWDHDARLIAAAPDLLECLRDLLTAAEAEVNEKGGGGFILARMTDARAAIAKAAGKSLEDKLIDNGERFLDAMAGKP